MIRTMLAFLADEPPVMVDWLPWHHTAGGNHNFGLVLYNGGSLYIDDGRPTAAEIGATVQNLREIATTFYVNVPKGFEVLLPHLERDAGAAPALLQPAAPDVLRRRRARPARLGGLAAPGARDHRRAHPDADRARCHRDRALRLHARQGGEPGGRGRPAGARHPAQARAARGRALRGPPEGPQHHPRLLAPARGHGGGLRRRGLLPARRRASFSRPRAPGKRLRVRRPDRRGVQALERHLGQRRRAPAPAGRRASPRCCATR